MKKRVCNEKDFMENVSGHKIEILKDDGLYRHIRFSKNGSSVYRFDLITYPGHLVISGDMGAYVFARLEDMFDFFRSDSLEINPQYWSQKCVSEDRHGHIEKFDNDVFEESVINWIDGWPEDSKKLVHQLILNNHYYDEHEALSEVYNFSDGCGLHYFDTSEISCMNWDYGFLWCLYAIVWGIKQYDMVSCNK